MNDYEAVPKAIDKFSEDLSAISNSGEGLWDQGVKFMKALLDLRRSQGGALISAYIGEITGIKPAMDACGIS